MSVPPSVPPSSSEPDDGPPPYGPPVPYGYGPPPPPYGPPVPYGYGPPPGYSHRTKVAAGLLQLLPGFILAIGGIGRCYTGHVAVGVIHIVLSVVGWLTTPILIGIPIVAACWLWAVIDGIVLLAGTPRDAEGRLLR